MPEPASTSYFTPLPAEEEWRVLLTLSQAPSPAQSCRALNWRTELFNDPETASALARLASAQRSLPLALPPALDGLLPYNEEELRSARQRMARAALLTRLLPDYQGNLRDRLLSMMDARVPGDGDVERFLAGLMETTLGGMETSLSTLRAVFSSIPRESATVTTQGELDAGYWDRIAAMREAASTGFRALDRILSGGLHPQRLFIFLGAPGGGKTTLANQIGEYVASRGRPVVYLACEEPPATLYAKTLSRLGDVDYAAAQFGWSQYRSRIDAARALANERLSATRLLYIEGFTGLSDLRETAQAHFQRYADELQRGGPGLLIVDYLQCIAQIISRLGSGGNLSETQLISLLTYDLRALAKELNCTVIAISRQNRASGYGNSNALTSGSGSGGIEYGSDVILSIDKEEDRPAPIGYEVRSLVLPKNRLGRPDKLSLYWKGDRQRFVEPSSEGEWEDDDDKD